MSDFQKLAHALWQCKYHVVWCPKYRFQILEGKVGQGVEEQLRQLCEWKKVEWVEGNGDCSLALIKVIRDIGGHRLQ